MPNTAFFYFTRFSTLPVAGMMEIASKIQIIFNLSFFDRVVNSKTNFVVFFTLFVFKYIFTYYSLYYIIIKNKYLINMQGVYLWLITTKKKLKTELQR